MITVVTILFATLIVMALAYAVKTHIRRHRFVNQLRMARITPDELKHRLDTNKDLVIVDLRHALDFLPEPYTIPGAIRIPMDQLEERQAEIPRGREVVVYCTCPNEASSVVAAVNLRKYGITRVRPLAGGFHAWRERGYPVYSQFGTLTALEKAGHSDLKTEER